MEERRRLLGNSVCTGMNLAGGNGVIQDHQPITFFASKSHCNQRVRSRANFSKNSRLRHRCEICR